MHTITTHYQELDYELISVYLYMIVNSMSGLPAEEHCYHLMIGYLCRYVMDELGSAMRHSDSANFRMAPFLFMPEGKLATAIRYWPLKRIDLLAPYGLLISNIFSYTILWPTNDVHTGEECTRDFLFGIGEDKQRSARLTAWFRTPENYFVQAILLICFFFYMKILISALEAARITLS